MSWFNVLLILVALGVAGLGLLRAIPPQDSPLAPLDLAVPIGWATRSKLVALAERPEACALALRRAGIAFRPLADRREDGFCGYEGAVALAGGAITDRGGPVRVSCRLAAGLALWEREVVAPAALRHFSVPIHRIEQAGTYACRRIYGHPAAAPSQHASANAIDITGFRLRDGRAIAIAGGWDGSNHAAADFLRDVRDGACRIFGGVLGPDYNAAHRDHLHLDMGPHHICR